MTLLRLKYISAPHLAVLEFSVETRFYFWRTASALFDLAITNMVVPSKYMYFSLAMPTGTNATENIVQDES